MKSSISFAMVLALAVALSLGASAGETVVRMDTSEGASSGHWVAFVGKASAEGAAMGTIGTAVGKGEKFDAAFGMSVNASKPVVGALEHATLKEARESEEDPGATTILVSVTEAQYKKVKAAIEKYPDVDASIDGPVNVLINFTQEALDALGLRRPYRSGLSPVNPVMYYSDIPRMNRNLIKEDS